jgi:hypothetical protein
MGEALIECYATAVADDGTEIVVKGQGSTHYWARKETRINAERACLEKGKRLRTITGMRCVRLRNR